MTLEEHLLAQSITVEDLNSGRIRQVFTGWKLDAGQLAVVRGEGGPAPGGAGHVGLAPAQQGVGAQVHAELPNTAGSGQVDLTVQPNDDDGAHIAPVAARSLQAAAPCRKSAKTIAAKLALGLGESALVSALSRASSSLSSR